VAFKGMEIGASSALAMMMLCLLVILSFVYFHFLRITSDSR
jgi:ABC-type sugar transport system permease subunit